MEIAKGSKVRIRYQCRLEDGKVYHVGEKDRLEFVIGAGAVPASLEAGLLGAHPADRRTVRVPAAEVNLFPFPWGAYFAVETETPPGIGYEFGPGEGGDVSLSIPPRHFREPLPPGADLIFEIEVLAVEEGGAP